MKGKKPTQFGVENGRSRMRRKSQQLFWAVASFLLLALPVFAHHSFAAEFDSDKPITIKGVLTKLSWQNPHVYFYVDVKDSDGKVVNWGVEAHPTGFMHRAGITSDMIVEGQPVTVDGWRAKDGTKNLIFLRAITFEDGRKIATSQ
jgi:hypothetical protein